MEYGTNSGFKEKVEPYRLNESPFERPSLAYFSLREPFIYNKAGRNYSARNEDKEPYKTERIKIDKYGVDGSGGNVLADAPFREIFI